MSQQTLQQHKIPVGAGLLVQLLGCQTIAGISEMLENLQLNTGPDDSGLARLDNSSIVDAICISNSTYLSPKSSLEELARDLELAKQRKSQFNKGISRASLVAPVSVSNGCDALKERRNIRV
jgi:hypothetical protein